ncbi:hypothetical protein ACFSCW_16555 [Sphingomonas tabacisoli]|uniref:Uncharacterized protein n=1 Tax=Sphingomonas tabacisoli TaxID=2249466 RepID=A0ABW4I7M6_9SPHN
MATLIDRPLVTRAGDERFFLGAAIGMTLVIFAGFSLQLAAGRSTFYSPPLVHAHAIVFMGWVTIYLAQNILVATDRMAIHRRLGWVAAGWIVPMIVLGFCVTIAMVRRGQVPFFFQPLHFLLFDPLTLLTFAGLTAAAIVMRDRTEWHRRLHLCGMAMLLAPGFGRLLPMPLLQPWAWEASFAASMMFPLAGLVRDLRRDGHVHPAWRAGIMTMIGAFVLIEALTYSGTGQALYRVVTAQSPGAAVPPLQFAAPPASGLVTGRS